MTKHRKQYKKGMTNLVKEQVIFIESPNELFEAFTEAREEFKKNHGDEDTIDYRYLGGSDL